ncbi:MAG: hypothetical protein ACOCX1_00925 [Fimbriimonadaceae bacterium]
MISFAFLFVIILLLVGVGVVAAVFMNQLAKNRSTSHPSELAPDTRTLLAPFRELHRSLQEIVDKNRDVAEIKVVGELAIEESARIQERATKLLEMRSELKRTLYGQSEAKAGLIQLKERMVKAESDTERSSLESAIQAREQELEHYRQVEATMHEVDGKLREAEASLAELKARLATGAMGARASAIDAEDISGMVERLKGLSQSFSEAEEMIEDRIR